MDFNKILEMMVNKMLSSDAKGIKPFWALLWTVIFLVVYWRLPDLLAAIAALR